jgi:uncharacterized protein YwgA
MKNSEKYAVVLSLLHNLREWGSWCGETHLQKSMFFLEELGRVPTDFEFMLYKHGPFSFLLRDVLNDLRSIGFVELEFSPPYGPRYKLSTIGRDYLEQHSSEIEPWAGKVDAVARCLGDKKVQQLERLGTALLVKEDAIDENARAQRIHMLKPHVSLKDALAAIQELESIIVPCVSDACAPHSDQLPSAQA